MSRLLRILSQSDVVLFASRVEVYILMHTVNVLMAFYREK